MKKVAAIHDLSCFGRGSLTTVIPILSGMGVQVCPLPTTLLSTHTGGFENFSFLDLTDNMQQVMNHWKKLGLTFDGIYTGFLGCPEQIDLVGRFITEFKREDTLICIDPVMGDNGRMYEVYDGQMAEGMRRVIKYANVITPNLTEACLLAKMEYEPHPTKETLMDIAKALFDLGPSHIVITGIERGHQMDTIIFENGWVNTPLCISSCRIVGDYPGTGDLFASVMVGEMTKGSSLLEAVRKGVYFTVETMKQTVFNKVPPREGLAFEECFSRLIKEEDKTL